MRLASFTIASTSTALTLSMILCPRVRTVGMGLAALAVLTGVMAGCRKKETPAPPVATPSLTLNHDKAPLGSPLDIHYKFVVANDAHFAEDYRVMVHVVDADEELIFAFDHNPPVPTKQWKPGQTIEYTRTEFIPIYPYVGEASIQIGLHSTINQKRLPLAGQDAGQKAYKVARIQLQPQTENVFTVFKDGWHPAEVAEHNSTVEWQWTKKEATLSFKNPKKDCLFYLDVDNPGSAFNEAQQVQVSLGGQPVDQFTLEPKEPQLRKIPLKAAQLGSADVAEIVISVDKTYVPAVINVGSKDPRELGIRVFHAFVDPR
ncbi:MAG TPA: hypothetical protein VKE51_06850 [Vicinamibacterales bacterium]|nr:hypothetical protein [Vicinamibacterales bacterium]